MIEASLSWFERDVSDIKMILACDYQSWPSLLPRVIDNMTIRPFINDICYGNYLSIAYLL